MASLLPRLPKLRILRRLATLEEQQKVTQSDIDALTTELGQVKSTLTEIQTDVATISTGVSTLETQNATLQQEIATLQANNPSVDLTALQAAASDLVSTTGTIKTAADSVAASVTPAPTTTAAPTSS